MDDRSFAADWTNQTTAHPLGLAVLVVLGLLLLVLPRRYAPLTLIVMACFVAPAQRIVVAGLDFDFLRIMVLCGWTRILIRGEARGLIWKPIDTAIVAWATVGLLAFTILYGDFTNFVNRLGFMSDAVGMYFMFRILVRDWLDLERIVFSFIIVSIPVLIAFTIERLTGRNAFAVLGGVPEVTTIREGRLRCQGAFAHPIMAGCFFAALMPLFAARWWQSGAARKSAIIGLACAAIIVVMTASSTPAMGVVIGLLGGCMYWFRRRLRLIRWGAVVALLGLHLIMNAPVWHLISRINVVGGSTGWHRYYLIDQAIENVGEWWLLGTASTAHWGYGLHDVTNQYVLEGVRGGLLTLGFFVVTIALAFRGVGQRLRLVRHDTRLAACVWAIGVSLFVHCVCFLSVSYFGQIRLLWYLTLAMAGSLTPAAAAAGATLRRARAATPSLRPARSGLQPVTDVHQSSPLTPADR